jgi:hypothetical protein
MDTKKNLDNINKMRAKQKPMPTTQKQPKRRSASGRDKALQMKPRLPMGSAFSCVWDGKTWMVALIVPVGGVFPDGRFSASGNGLFGTLEKADDLYRKSLNN